jgi:hypothetical protein
MLNVVLGYKAPGEPDDEQTRKIEGWMLGKTTQHENSYAQQEAQSKSDREPQPEPAREAATDLFV